MAKCRICGEREGVLNDVTLHTDDKIKDFKCVCRECAKHLDEFGAITVEGNPQYTIRTKDGHETVMVVNSIEEGNDIIRARELSTVCEVHDNWFGEVTE